MQANTKVQNLAIKNSSFFLNKKVGLDSYWTVTGIHKPWLNCTSSHKLWPVLAYQSVHLWVIWILNSIKKFSFVWLKKKWSLSWFPNNPVGLTSLVQFSKQWTLLTLEQRPIAYHGQELKGKALHLSTYETKLLSLVNVVESGGLIH